MWVGSLFLILQPFVVRWSMGLDLSEVLIFQGGEKKNQVFSVTFPGSSNLMWVANCSLPVFSPSPSRPWLVTWAWSCAEDSDPDCTAESQGSLLVLSSPDILAQGPSSPAGQSICWDSLHRDLEEHGVWVGLVWLDENACVEGQ